MNRAHAVFQAAELRNCEALDADDRALGIFRLWPSPIDHRLGTPDTPAICFARAVDFVASLVR